MNDHIVWWLVGLGWIVTVPVGLERIRLAGRDRWVAIAWLPVAAAWAAAAGLGLRPLGYSDEIVLLTAAHFVHAGFGVSALLVSAGLRRSLGIHQIGMGSVALGIAVARPFELIGAVAIVIALAGYSVHAGRRACGETGVRRLLLVVSALAWWFPMVLATGWAAGRVGIGWIDRTLDEMVAQHGAVNAIGLVLAGLVAHHPGSPRRRPAHAMSLRRPNQAVLAELVVAGRGSPLSVSPGLLARGGRGWFLDVHTVEVGRGATDFEVAKHAIAQWVKFRQPWTTPAIPLAPIEPGVTVGYAARVWGVWWSCCCRIVDVIDERSTDGGDRFGFTYATIAGHPERGEERFLVTLDATTGSVTFEIVAMSRPGRWFVWLGLPIARRAQARFRSGAAEVLARSVADARPSARLTADPSLRGQGSLRRR